VKAGDKINLPFSGSIEDQRIKKVKKRAVQGFLLFYFAEKNYLPIPKTTESHLL
jgi:hypothetical protein